MADIDSMLSSGVDASNDTFIIMAASIYILEGVSMSHHLMLYSSHLETRCSTAMFKPIRFLRGVQNIHVYCGSIV